MVESLVRRAGLSLWILAAVLLLPGNTSATERQWRLGADPGYWLTGLPEGTVSGFGGGGHLTYGLTDAFNLRLNADLSGYSLPPPLTKVLLWDASFGIEYVVDILDWVPTVGVLAGPTGIERDEGEQLYLAVELPAYLGYHLSEDFAVGAEARYRLLLFGTDVAPISQLAIMARGEIIFDP